MYTPDPPCRYTTSRIVRASQRTIARPPLVSQATSGGNRADRIDQDWDRMRDALQLSPKQQWQHLKDYQIEWSLPSRLRPLQIDAAGRFKKVGQLSRSSSGKHAAGPGSQEISPSSRLPHSMKDVYQAAQYANRVPVNQVSQSESRS